MRRLPVLLFLAGICAGQQPETKVVKQAAMEMALGRARFTQQMVDSIFSFAELGYQEVETSRYITGLLEKNGFRVTRGVAGLDTGWIAEWGSGKPVIGLMADIDGLPETSQTPGVAYHKPLVDGAPGHGEGHNAGQALQVTAALVAKDLMERYKIQGTIRVYPGVAEELIGSRTFMVNAGLFKDVDAMLSAHISSDFGVTWGPAGTGLVSVEYTFHGRSAHGATPWNGRSALDAVELMNIGWNYRREHLRTEQRSHYVVTAGGDQPNVVPPIAKVWYYFREWDYPRIQEMHAIGTRIAQGAAAMTDTTMEERVLGAAWPGMFNRPIAEALGRNIAAVGMPKWSEADQTLARAAQKEISVELKGLKSDLFGVKDGNQAEKMYGSDDIAEVGWNIPTVVLRYPGNIPGMIGHHWSSGIAMATPIAHKGATAGAAAQAMTVIDLMLDPSLLAEARKFFAEQTRETKWKSLIPVETKPPTYLNRDRQQKYRPALERLYFDSSRYSTYLEQLGVQYPTVK
jgi:aminobenzoyl-glutamate utilization protein B